MNTINQTINGCYLLASYAFGVATEKTFNKHVLNAPTMKIDGLYTYPDTTFKIRYNKPEYKSRRAGTDFYDQRNITLLIENEFLPAQFNDPFNNRMKFYTNSDGNSALITVSKVIISHNDVPHNFLNSTIAKTNSCSNQSAEWWYSIVTNTILPDVDIMAPKLMSI